MASYTNSKYVVRHNFIRVSAGILLTYSLLTSEAQSRGFIDKYIGNRGDIQVKDRRLFDTYWPLQYYYPNKTEVNDSNYDPFAGYEPYWPHAYWYHNASRLPTKDPRCLYTSCPLPFKLWGPVCGRKDSLLKNFSDYCELLDLQCTDTGFWSLVTRGPCPPLPEVQYFPVFYLQTTAANHVVKWRQKTLTTQNSDLNDWNKRFRPNWMFWTTPRIRS